MTYKIGVVGEQAVILPFKMLGFDTFHANEAVGGRKIVTDLAEKRYGIIYITEELATLIPETLKRYDAEIMPIITLIPTHLGTLAIGKSRIQENVEKAVGQNIL